MLRSTLSMKASEEELFKFFARISKTHEYEYKDEYKKAYQYFFPEGEGSPIPEQVLDYINYKSWFEQRLRKRTA